jgi:site-specific recombinase XerC
MAINLQKGQRVSLDNSMKLALVGLGWDTNRYDGGSDFDLDASAFLLGENGKLLPVPCYANCKNGIKAIAKLCGINKNVTWHQSRHSYATTICLSNGVPIETLSKMMGHTSIRSTQIYAKITAEKVSSDMERLARQIESMEQFICQTI